MLQDSIATKDLQCTAKAKKDQLSGAFFPFLLLLMYHCCNRGRRQRGGQWSPAPPFKLCAPHLMFGPPNYHEAVEFLCAVGDSE